MRAWIIAAFTGLLVLGGASSARAGFSFQIGTDDFFLSVGDYDYLPYAYQDDRGYRPPPISFRDMMGQYGRWVTVRPFGSVWRPYASYGWRPYAYGHWLYTEYGPYWEGYEPWAWVAYHYGSWIFTRQYGWAWVPGYEWHPGRVTWAHGYDTIGWMPRPPDGYDYRRGYLSYVGSASHFRYSDDDFGADYDFEAFGYGESYGGWRDDRRYDSPFASIDLHFWVFIDAAQFGQDNYADYDLGADYSRYAFEQQEIRVSNRPMQKSLLEHLIRQPLPAVPVVEQHLRADQRSLRVVLPSDGSSTERIRRQSPNVVEDVIAPAFADAQRQFKGRRSKIQGPVNRIFRQDEARVQLESRSPSEVIDQAREAQQARERSRRQQLESIKQRSPRERGKNRPDSRPNDPRRRPPVESEQRAPVVEPPAPPPSAPNPVPEPRPRRGPIPPLTSETPPVKPAPPVEVRPVEPAPPAGPGRSNDQRRHVAPGRRLGPAASGQQNDGDAALAQAISEKLRAELSTLASGVVVNARDGVATLSGRASHPGDVEKIVQLVSGIPGVKRVDNRIAIRQPRVR